MVIEVKAWLKANEQTKERTVKEHLRQVINFEDSTKYIVEWLTKEHPKSDDLKVYSEVLEYIQKK